MKMLIIFVFISAVAGVGYFFIGTPEESVDLASIGLSDDEPVTSTVVEIAEVNEVVTDLDERTLLEIEAIEGVEERSQGVDPKDLPDTRAEYDAYVRDNPVRLSEEVARSKKEDRELLRRYIDAVPEDKKLEFLLRLREAISGEKVDYESIPKLPNGEVDYDRYIKAKSSELNAQDELLKKQDDRRAIIVE